MNPRPDSHAVPWIPPSETEHLLREAALRGDFAEQVRVLAGAELFIGAPKAEVDAEPDDVYWRPQQVAKGLVVRQVLTRGCCRPGIPNGSSTRSP